MILPKVYWRSHAATAFELLEDSDSYREPATRLGIGAGIQKQLANWHAILVGGVEQGRSSIPGNVGFEPRKDNELSARRSFSPP